MRIAPALVLAAVILSIAASGPAAEKGDADRTTPPAAADIRRALARPISIDLAGQSLAAAAIQLGKRIGVPIEIDPQANEEHNRLPTTFPVRAEKRPAGQVTLFGPRACRPAVLDLLVRQAHLDWLVGDQGVLITSPEAVAAKTELAVYKVSDLVGPLAGKDAVRRKDSSHKAGKFPHPDLADEDLWSRQPVGAEKPRDAAPSPCADLIDLIQATVFPHSADEDQLRRRFPVGQGRGAVLVVNEGWGAAGGHCPAAAAVARGPPCRRG